MGLIFQNPEDQLFEETVSKDIAFGLKKMGVPDTEIEKRVLEAAEITGLPANVLERSPFELSGGQKRRVAIAGVIAMNPEILVLDEPTQVLILQAAKKYINFIETAKGKEHYNYYCFTYNGGYCKLLRQSGSDEQW